MFSFRLATHSIWNARLRYCNNSFHCNNPLCVVFDVSLDLAYVYIVLSVACIAVVAYTL